MAEHTPRGPKGVKAPKALPQKPKRGKKPQDELQELRDHLPSVPRAPLAKSLTAAQRKMLLKGAKKKAETSQTGGIPSTEYGGQNRRVTDMPTIDDVVRQNEQWVIDQLYEFGYDDIITVYNNIIETIEYNFGANILSEILRITDEPYLTWEDLMYFPEKVSNEMTKYMTAIVNGVYTKVFMGYSEYGEGEEDQKIFDELYELIQTMQDSYVGDETIHFSRWRK